MSGHADAVDRLGDDVRVRVLGITRTPQRRQMLLELGLGDADLRRLVRRQVLQHHYGHYLDGRVDEQLARMACAQVRHPGSVVSHFSAALLAGLSTWTDSRRPLAPPLDAVWLTRPSMANRNQQRRDIIVRRAALTPADLSRHGWLPVTSTARTVVDVARALPRREGIVTVDQALRSGVSLADLQAVIERQFQWPGIRRAAFEIPDSDKPRCNDCGNPWVRRERPGSR